MTVKIGYYDVGTGKGVGGQKHMVVDAGANAVRILDPSALGSSDVLFLENGNKPYGAEFLAAIPGILDWVRQDGGITLFYDRATRSEFFSGFVHDEASPGSEQANFVNDAGPGAVSTIGQIGTITDGTLDEGNHSNHGYAALADFQDGEYAWLQTRDDPTRAVTVMQSDGAGYIIQSSLTLDSHAIRQNDSNWSKYGTYMLEFTSDLSLRNVVQLTNGKDTGSGTNFMDDVFLKGGADKYDARGGNDLLHGGLGRDNLKGGDGHDYLWGDEGNDHLAGDNGNDQLWGGEGADKLDGNLGADFLVGGSSDDTLHGNRGQDTLYGGDGDDVLIGGSLSDADDNDVIIGGAGADVMTGGAGVQIYYFAPGDAPFAFPHDIITDFFSTADKINLSGYGIAFTFSADGDFHNVANEIALKDFGDGSTYVYIDYDGDGAADQLIQLQLGLGSGQATASDFII